MREKNFTEEEAEKRWEKDMQSSTARRRFEDDELELAVAGHWQEVRKTGHTKQAKTTPSTAATSLRKALRKLTSGDESQEANKAHRADAPGQRTSRSPRRKAARRACSRTISSSPPPRSCQGRRRSISRSPSRRPRMKPQVRVRAQAHLLARQCEAARRAKHVQSLSKARQSLRRLHEKGLGLRMHSLLTMGKRWTEVDMKLKQRRRRCATWKT